MTNREEVHELLTRALVLLERMAHNTDAIETPLPNRRLVRAADGSMQLVEMTDAELEAVQFKTKS